jgi:hypothetical protein
MNEDPLLHSLLLVCDYGEEVCANVQIHPTLQNCVVVLQFVRSKFSDAASNFLEL